MAGTKRKADTDSKKKKTRKTKKAKDPDAPKRNKSAYMFFCEAKRGDVKKANPDLKMTDISKKLAEQWRGLDKDDKKTYDKQAEADKKRYEKEKKEYEDKQGEKSEDDEEEEDESD